MTNFIKEILKISQKAGKSLQLWGKRLHRPRAPSQHVHGVYERYLPWVKAGWLWFGRSRLGNTEKTVKSVVKAL
jgi:hypothetical protein